MIRFYQPEDKNRLLEILRLNIPEYFAHSEEQDFIEYLDTDSTHYFVFEDAGQVVGAGGVNFIDDGKEARISWDLFHPNAQGKGFGSQLVKFRLEYIKNNSNVERVVVRTSQVAFQFYEHQGFVLKEVAKDYWAEGFDLYRMELANF